MKKGQKKRLTARKEKCQWPVGRKVKERKKDGGGWSRKNGTSRKEGQGRKKGRIKKGCTCSIVMKDKEKGRMKSRKLWKEGKNGRKERMEGRKEWKEEKNGRKKKIEGRKTIIRGK